MAGYIRQDTTNNIANGNIINANDLDNEYDAIAAAFGAITGHKHDGTDAEGAPITKVGPVQDVVVSSTAVTPKTDNTVDLGSSTNEFKDLYIDGVANIDSLVADTADINGGTIDNASVGATTPSTGAFTTLSATGAVSLSGGTANGVLYLNGSKAVSSGSGLVFDGSNLGVGVTPSAWNASARTLQFGAGGTASLENFNGLTATIYQNAWRNSSNQFIYSTSAPASSFGQFNGAFTWGIAPSGTAGNPISFTQAMTLDASGNLGVGATDPSTKLHVQMPITAAQNSVREIFLRADSDGTNNSLGSLVGVTFSNRWAGQAYTAGSFAQTSGVYGVNTDNGPFGRSMGLAFYTSGIDSTAAERARIDSSGNLLVGTTTPTAKLSVAAGYVTGSSQVYTAATFSVTGGNGGFNGSGSRASFGVMHNGGVGAVSGIGGVLNNGGSGGNDFSGDLTLYTKNASDSGLVERARIDSSGNLLVGTTSGSGHTINKAGAFVDNAQVLSCQGGNGADSFAIYATNRGMGNVANTAVRLGSSASTARSINASGTINASGADYAEYENNNGLTISKGDVVGFKADGTLTLTFSEAVRFGIKSTNPSYVGGDTWGTEDKVGKRPVEPASDADQAIKDQYAVDLAAFEARLEAERQKVDRIAYSGKVPVNVYGATPGGYVIAAEGVDGVIVGEFVADVDFAQYKRAVGRVNKLLPDGRCEVAVIIH